MGEVYTYNATHLTTVREGSVELVQCAELGQIGSGQFALDDTAGTQAIIGHKDFAHTESSCAFPLTHRGFIGDRSYGRDAGIERKPHVGAGRGVGVQVSDLNPTLGFRILYQQSDMTATEAGNRPAETVDERIAWLMASPFVDGLFVDGGRIDSSIKAMTATDYRYQYPGDVLADCALAAGGWNYHVNDWGSGAELTFRNDNTSSADPSTLRLSNVLADASGVTLNPFKDATLERRPGRVFSLLALSWARGTQIAERVATATAFNGERGGTVSNANIKTAAKADDELVDLLWQHHTEEDVLTCTVLVTSAQVNLIRAGMRIEAKFSHLATEGYGSFTWFRILERSVKPIVADGGLYELRLKLSPQEAAPAVGEIVQSAFARGWEDGVYVTLPNPVTVGSWLVVCIADRSNRDPEAPASSASLPHIGGTGAWTRMNGATITATGPALADHGIAFFYKEATATDREAYNPGSRVNMGIWELPDDVDLAGAEIVDVNEETGAPPYTIGTLTTAATTDVCLMGIVMGGETGYDNERLPLATVDSGVWTPRLYQGAYTWNPGLGAAEKDPIVWMGDTIGTGAAVDAEISASPTHWPHQYFAGIAVRIPKA